MCFHDMRRTDQSKRSNKRQVQTHHSNINVPEPPRSPHASKNSTSVICQNQRKLNKLINGMIIPALRA